MSRYLTIALASLFLLDTAFGHGEDKLGPHQGLIRMPGGFHTELVKTGESEFIVYLLDINWKNPTIQGSSVTANLKSAKSEARIDCSPEKEYFECKLPKNFKFKVLKEISLQTKRGEMPGGAAVYSVPLKTSKH